MKDSYRCSDRVSIRFRATEMKANAVVAGDLIVTEQNSGTVVRRQQNIEVAIAIEVSVRQSPTNTGLAKFLSNFRCYILEAAFSVEKQLWRLCVANISTNISDGVVNMPIGHKQILRSVEIDVEEGAAEAQRVA